MDTILVNGNLIKRTDMVAPLGVLPGYDFIYQRVHTLEHKPLHPKTHIEILDISCERLYGCVSGLTKDLLATEIEMLLKNNRYPKGSNLITVYILPPKTADDSPTRVLICEKQLLYKGYTLWHKAFKAMVTPYEYPFPEHKTAVSMTAHEFSQGYAERSMADIAITTDQAEVITGVGENPIFAVRGNDILTTPLEGFGTAQSVERLLGIEAALTSGIKIYEEPLLVKDLKTYDELFFIGPQGIVSIGECRGKLYPNSMAKRVASHLNDIILDM